MADPQEHLDLSEMNLAATVRRYKTLDTNFKGGVPDDEE